MLICTAGHVDHGKTVLVKALTGVDTDRLPEEKKRGLSIDLGFAYTTLGARRTLGFVDVPGHERFIRNMLAGVAAIDFALLVVAVDDGPMPQTREHLAILDLLGIRRGAVALTKIDLAEADRIAEVRSQIEALVAGTVLAGAPVFPVAAQRGEGVDALAEHLRAAADALEESGPARGSKFRLAIDRDFSVHGAGTVVTGAVFSGEVRVGDRVLLAPARVPVRVRAIHAQNEPAEVGRAGQRCALNLAGGDLGRTEIHRGDWVVAEPAPEPSRRIDAELRVLASEERALRHWTPVHVHLAAASLTGRVAILEARAIPPGGTGLVQIVLDQATVAAHGDRFILRDQSARRTLAGGDVIDPLGATRGRARPERIAELRALQAPSPGDALALLLERTTNGVDLEHFAQGWNLTTEEGAALFEAAGVVEVTVRRTRLGLKRDAWESTRAALLAGLAQWHADHRDQIGPDETQLRLVCKLEVHRDLIAAAVAGLVREGRMVRDGTHLRLPEHEPTLSPRDAALWEKLGRHVTPSELKPPVVTELASRLGVEKEPLVAFLSRSVGRGQLVRVAPNRFYHPVAIRRLAGIAEDLAGRSQSGRFDAKAYRDASGIGRNLTIQVLEYFDGSGLTRRIGDERRVIKSAADVFGGVQAEG